jgi:hypothetical protein
VIAKGQKLTPTLRELRNSFDAMPSARATSTVGNLEWVIETLDIGVLTVHVFVEPGGSDLVGDVDHRIAAHDGVRSTEVRTIEESYAEFRELFADEPEMLENVRPEDLPPQVVVTLAPDADIEGFIAWASDLDHIQEVRGGISGSASMASGAFLNEGDRRHWQELAGAMDDVEGHPRWAVLGAEVLRDVLKRGTEVVAKDPKVADRNHQAAELIDTEVTRCGLDG